MTPETKQDTILKLLSCWISGSSADFFAQLSNEDKLELCAYAEELKLNHFFARFLAPDELLPPPYDDQLCRSYQASVGLDMRRERDFRKALAMLSDADIDYIPLKGNYLAYHIYSTPSLRPRSDIDILLRDEDLERADAVFRAAGWVDADGGQRHTLHIAALHHKNYPTLIEPHFNIFRPDRVRPENSELWQMAYCFSRHEYHLPPEVVFTYLLDGGLRNNAEQLMLKTLVDLALLVLRSDITPEKLASFADKFDRTRDVTLILKAFPEMFPPEYPALFCEDVPEEAILSIRGFILDSRMDNTNSHSVDLSRDYSRNTQLGKIRFLLGGVFSPPSVLRHRYNIRRAWQIPYFYAVDLIRKARIFLNWRRSTADTDAALVAHRQQVLNDFLSRKD